VAGCYNFPKYRNLTSDDLAAWQKWVNGPDVAQCLDEIIALCTQFAERSRDAAGYFLAEGPEMRKGQPSRGESREISVINKKQNVRSLAAELLNARGSGLLDDLVAYVHPDIINQFADAVDEMDTVINFSDEEDEIRKRKKMKWTRQ
jgi:hypothetical protein